MEQNAVELVDSKSPFKFLKGFGCHLGWAQVLTYRVLSAHTLGNTFVYVEVLRTNSVLNLLDSEATSQIYVIHVSNFFLSS